MDVKHRLRMFEKTVLRKIFGPKRDNVTWKWRRPNNEKMFDLYSLLNVIRVVESKRFMWAVHVTVIGDRKDTHMVLVGKPEGKGPLGRPRHRQEYSMKMYVQEVGWGSMWSGLIWLRMETGGGRL